jgi:hypothetical protein
VAGTALLLLLATNGCSTDSPVFLPGGLGSLYGDAQVIDPDDPVYEDAAFDQAEVEQLFAEARDQGNETYGAYAAAREHAAALEYAFCSCGCASTIDHLSAVDCFKDMHGFW